MRLTILRSPVGRIEVMVADSDIVILERDDGRRPVHMTGLELRDCTDLWLDHEARLP